MQIILSSPNLYIRPNVSSFRYTFALPCRIGTILPSHLLTRSGIEGPGYLHEDEGFEKEIEMRTYSVVLVEPESMLVWHADYLDHVDGMKKA